LAHLTSCSDLLAAAPKVSEPATVQSTRTVVGGRRPRGRDL